MAIISEQTIEQIRAANDIVDVVGQHVQLKRAGGGSFKGLCPFHKEKTPSFNVNSTRQMFYCFGCHKGGNVFTFLMAVENVDFPTAARMLAERAGIRIEVDEGHTGEKGENKDTLFRLNEKVAAFYQRVLLEHPIAEAARKYLEDRKLGSEVVGQFLIGFAPPQKDALVMWAKKNNFTTAQMIAAGLLAQGEHDSDDFYDRFRGRLMFPIRDEQGRICGFSGRVLHKDQHPAKYVNTPETMLFKKSKLLYALDKARKPILESRVAIICEGQIDVIRCHSAGIDTAIAAQGTAVTEDHARLLKRYADSVILLMDSDTAGQTSAIRSSEIFLAAGMGVRVAALPQGEDPDSLILKQGADAMRAVIADNKSALDFQIDVLSKRENARDDAGIMRIARALLETISKAPSAVQRDQMIQQAAARLRVSPAAFQQDLRRVRAAPAPRGDDEEERPQIPEHPREEIELARVMLHHPEITSLVEQYVREELLEDADCRVIVRELITHAGEPGFQLASALGNETPECQRLAAELSAGDSTMIRGEDGAGPAVQDFITAIHRKSLMHRRRELEQQRASATGAEHDRIDMELKQLILDLKQLQQGWEKASVIIGLHLAS
jgi:DNA primase